MNKIIIPILAFCSAFMMTSCLGDDEPKDKVKDIVMYVSHETGIMYDGLDSEGRYPFECMLVMSEDNPGEWEKLPFGAIEGFTYEPGHEYDLLVRRTILANPPADGSNRRYSLRGILTDKLYKEPEPPKPEVPVTSEADIQYHDKCPFEKYGLYKSQFEVTSEGELFYADRRSTPGYDATRIFLEVVMDKGHPDFIEFNSVSYMAIFSYVFSPLTDEIRLVRNESSGPMFKNVIPADEFKYICDNIEVGTELRYTLFLVSIDKLGLQKLDFTVTKI